MTRLDGQGTRLLRWQPSERKTIYLCAILLGACGFVMIVFDRFRDGGVEIVPTLAGETWCRDFGERVAA
jgi:hypothetical protein